MNQPTVAAMRAASELRVCSNELSEIHSAHKWDLEAAEKIDRETGLPELIEALRRIHAMDNGQDLLNIGRQLAYDALRKAGAR